MHGGVRVRSAPSASASKCESGESEALGAEIRAVAWLARLVELMADGWREDAPLARDEPGEARLRNSENFPSPASGTRARRRASHEPARPAARVGREIVSERSPRNQQSPAEADGSRPDTRLSAYPANELQNTALHHTADVDMSGDSNHNHQQHPHNQSDSPPQQHLRRRPAHSILPDPEVPHAFELHDELLIGRGSGVHNRNEGTYTRLQCDRLPLMISREHAKISRESNRWAITDLSSRNGTYVNGTQLSPNVPQTMQENDIVCFGGPQHVQVDGSRSVNPFVFLVSNGPVPPQPKAYPFPPITRACTEPSTSDMQCNICLNILNAPRTLSSCGHSFCGDCLFSWLQRDHTCPLCRQDASKAPTDAITKCLALNSIIAHTEEERIGPEEIAERTERKRAVEEWESEAGDEQERTKRARM